MKKHIEIKLAAVPRVSPQGTVTLHVDSIRKIEEVPIGTPVYAEGARAIVYDENKDVYYAAEERWQIQYHLEATTNA